LKIEKRREGTTNRGYIDFNSLLAHLGQNANPVSQDIIIDNSLNDNYVRTLLENQIRKQEEQIRKLEIENQSLRDEIKALNSEIKGMLRGQKSKSVAGYLVEKITERLKW